MVHKKASAVRMPEKWEKREVDFGRFFMERDFGIISVWLQSDFKEITG